MRMKRKRRRIHRGSLALRADSIAPGDGILAVVDICRSLGDVDRGPFQAGVSAHRPLDELTVDDFPLTGAVHLLESYENVQTGVTTLLVVSINGCFNKPSFVRQLSQVEDRGIGTIPIIVDVSLKLLGRLLRGTPCVVNARSVRHRARRGRPHCAHQEVV